MNNTDRKWMYERRDGRGQITSHFIKGVKAFANFATSKKTHMDEDRIKCPCSKCCNVPYVDVDTVKLHLYMYGFVLYYDIWDKHGETFGDNINMGVEATNSTFHEENANTYTDMVLDATLPAFINTSHEEEPNAEDKKFFDMLQAADNDLWPSCKKVTQLSVVARLLNIKSDYRIPEQCYDDICQLINDVLPEENNMVTSLYDSKKLIQSLGLPVEVIDSCRSGCMIYWGVDKDRISCKKCKLDRYKPRSKSLSTRSRIPWKRMHFFPLTPRLKRLYASQATAASMRWHANNHGHDDGVMCHPSDSEAWKHFDNTYPSFAAETRNVRLGLCTDGFAPHGAFGKQYSSWPIIITPYNLPPSMCMKEPYMFLTAVVPGPTNPKHKLDVYLQPVIAELEQLWQHGVLTYDVSTKQNFQLRAALMWTISDFPAYAMLSGWSTAGKLACPHCGTHTQSFSLENGNKVSWFDCHRRFLADDHPYRANKSNFRKNRVETLGPPPVLNGEDILMQIEELGLVKVTEMNSEEVNLLGNGSGWKKRSIFWDLPYWKTNLIRHNLDVMHIEKNVFENFFYTIMDVKNKTKDNSKARKDLKKYCRKRNGVEENERAFYALERRQKKAVCEWVEKLRFPDGYVSNLGRCVDLTAFKLFGMKSHDCHVFLQRLMPIAFREMLPTKVWEAVTELSLFFKTLTSTSITLEEMEKIEADIPIILCKLETIFVPGIFNSMEHLPVHLPYEAKIGGPVQYRWMYQFEKYLSHLKRDIKNKARVEGSIVNAYLLREASMFCSHYFEPNVHTRNRNVPRNDDGGDDGGVDDDDIIQIFSYPGRPYGKLKKRMLTDEEFNAVHAYIILNEEQMKPYIDMFEELVQELHPDINEQQINDEVEKHFATWFENYARQHEIKNKYINDLSKRPLRTVKPYKVYFVNGYKFHTETHGENKLSMNSGVSISSGAGEYYGKILEILEIEYPGYPRKTTVVFKFHWYDPTNGVGVKVHKHYNLVDINLKRQFTKFEPFILAFQANQVCYMPYPTLKQNNSDWMAVFKVKPRGWTDIGEDPHQKDAAFQEDQVETNEIITNTTQYDGDYSSDSSDDEMIYEVEENLDAPNNYFDDGIAESKRSFEFSSSDEQDSCEEEDECDDSD